MQGEYTGHGKIKELKTIIGKHSPEKVLIVSGNNSYEFSGAKNQIENLLGNIQWYRHCGFEENPKFSELFEGALKLKKFDPDLIIAVGGGSVIDTAKIISTLPEDKNQAKLLVQGKVKPEKKNIPLIAIPTTAGSGSEATHFAVAYIEKEKYSVAHHQLLPDYVILDPELTYSMSPYQTAVSGMDALCQGIESYWAKGATSESQKYSREAISLLIHNIEKAVNNPDAASRKAMAKGANLAGKAINISKTTAPHALSYSLTTNFGLPHGHAVAILLGHFFVLNSEIAEVRQLKTLQKNMDELYSIMNCSTAYECENIFYYLLKAISLDTNITRKGLGPNLIQMLLKEINLERLENHPFSVNNNDIEKIFGKVINV